MAMIFAISKEEMLKQLLTEKLPKIIRNEGYQTKGEFCYYLFECDLDSEEYEEIYAFMKTLSEGDYAFIRINEDEIESEEQGNTYKFDLYVSMEIESPVGGVTV